MKGRSPARSENPALRLAAVVGLALGYVLAVLLPSLLYRLPLQPRLAQINHLLVVRGKVAANLPLQLLPLCLCGPVAQLLFKLRDHPLVVGRGREQLRKSNLLPKWEAGFILPEPVNRAIPLQVLPRGPPVLFRLVPPVRKEVDARQSNEAVFVAKEEVVLVDVAVFVALAALGTLPELVTLLAHPLLSW